MQDKIDDLCRLKEELHMLTEDVVEKVIKRDWSDIDDVVFLKDDSGIQIVQLRVFEPFQDPRIWKFPASWLSKHPKNVKKVEESDNGYIIVYRWEEA